MERSTRGSLALVAGSLGALVLAGSAHAGVTTTVSATDAAASNCSQLASGSGRSVVQVPLTANATGIVRARLSEVTGGGDWDLAVIDRATGKAVAGAAGWDSDELAEGRAESGMQLVAQACRFSGGASSAKLVVDVASAASGGTTSGKAQLVSVRTDTRADKKRLTELELDLTEHGTSTTVDVVLHGDADVKKLRDAGFTYRVRIADLAARAAADAAADRRFAAATAVSGLPSGRTEYRHLWDYDYDMKVLHLQNPTLTRPLTLNHRTWEGRRVYGLEITENAANVADGKPVFLHMGAHHAREWPSSEHTIEFAFDLIKSYRRGEARAKDAMAGARMIVVPVVNRDGFNVSREARGVNNGSQVYGASDHEMKRKNCFGVEGVCATANRLAGVDPNRNYGGFWGGPGAGLVKHDDTWRGPGPFSEPETQNVRELVSSRQVVTLITNHTYGNLLLRPPGLVAAGRPIDEPMYRGLGDAMAEHNHYASQPSYALYDTTGGTEDWTYYATGGFGFTFEINQAGFHPAFKTAVLDEYLGTNGRAGNRGAYWEILKATTTAGMHSVIKGTAPAGATLTLTKAFQTLTSPVVGINGQIGDPIAFPDRLESRLAVTGKAFEWHVNPSTRPVVMGTYGRTPDPSKGVSPTQELANPPGIPPEDPSSQTGEDVVFEVKPDAGVDNGRMTVNLQWADARDDWDIQLYNATGRQITASESYGDNDEAAVHDDPAFGTYRVRVINWDNVTGADWQRLWVTFDKPTPGTPPSVPGGESYTLTCSKGGAAREVKVARGQTVDLGAVCGR